MLTSLSHPPWVTGKTLRGETKEASWEGENNITVYNRVMSIENETKGRTQC